MITKNIINLDLITIQRLLNKVRVTEQEKKDAHAFFPTRARRMAREKWAIGEILEWVEADLKLDLQILQGNSNLDEAIREKDFELIDATNALAKFKIKAQVPRELIDSLADLPKYVWQLWVEKQAKRGRKTTVKYHQLKEYCNNNQNVVQLHFTQWFSMIIKNINSNQNA